MYHGRSSRIMVSGFKHEPTIPGGLLTVVDVDVCRLMSFD